MGRKMVIIKRLKTFAALAATLAFTRVSIAADKPAENPIRPRPVDRRSYIHNWQTLPSFTARMLPSLAAQTVQPELGRIEVQVFLASWNVTSQRIIHDLAHLERRFPGVAFVYLFSHDQAVDAKAFLKEYPMRGRAFLANSKVLGAHTDPKIPTLIIADKNNWLTYRTSKFSPRTFAKIDRLLTALTGL